MAIVTNDFRYLLAERFFTTLQDEENTRNLYFFIGRSMPWTDPEAVKGSGTLTLPIDSNILTITNGVFDSSIVIGSQIKNMDTGEIRSVSALGQSPDQLIVHAPAGAAWNTTNWAFKTSSNVWVDDDNPPTPDGSLFNCVQRFDDMLAVKKINGDNLEESMSYVFPRNDWDSTGHTVYFPYRQDDGNLFLHPTEEDLAEQNAWNSQHPLYADQYYAGSHTILVFDGNNFHAFKCLDTGGVKNKSTDMPDKTNLDDDYIFNGSDGYKWKFLYSLTGHQVLSFLTKSWVPVRKATVLDTAEQSIEQYLVQENAALKDKGIEAILLESQTSGIISFGSGSTGETIPDQSSADLNEVILPVEATVQTADYYKGSDLFTFDIEVNSAKNAIKKRIVAYDPATNKVTVDSAFTQENRPSSSTTKICIAPAVTIDGFQSPVDLNNQASARTIVENGVITKIVMITKGKNYRFATATVTQTADNVACATVYVVISPSGGHGSNAVKETGASMVTLVADFGNPEGQPNADGSYDFIQTNDYRAIGLIRNVKDNNTQDYAQVDTLKSCSTLQLTNVNLLIDFQQDEIVEQLDDQGNVVARAYVVEFLRNAETPANATLSFVQDPVTEFGVFSVSQTLPITGERSGSEGLISVVETPEMVPYEGEILYIEQKKKVIRESEQTESIKIIIEF